MPYISQLLNLKLILFIYACKYFGYRYRSLSPPGELWEKLTTLEHGALQPDKQSFGQTL